MAHVSPDPSQLLRLALRGNAAFSIASGLGFVLARQPVAEFLGGVTATEVATIGLQLVVFAAFLVWLAARPSPSIRLSIAVVAADLLWVAGTAVVLGAGLFTQGGAIAALVVADVVLAFALVQALGIRRLRNARRGAHA